MFFCDFDLINESFERKWKLAKVRHQKSMSGRHTSGYRLRTKKYRVALALTRSTDYAAIPRSENGAVWIRSLALG
ncbi:Uncharacterised protein [Salmonella enterica subsp. salamae]|nr:Uncharacterised protein [Salmonella enterica subsp. salamae]